MSHIESRYLRRYKLSLKIDRATMQAQHMPQTCLTRFDAANWKLAALIADVCRLSLKKEYDMIGFYEHKMQAMKAFYQCDMHKWKTDRRLPSLYGRAFFHR